MSQSKQEETKGLELTTGELIHNEIVRQIETDADIEGMSVFESSLLVHSDEEKKRQAIRLAAYASRLVQKLSDGESGGGL